MNYEQERLQELVDHYRRKEDEMYENQRIKQKRKESELRTNQIDSCRYPESWEEALKNLIKFYQIIDDPTNPYEDFSEMEEYVKTVILATFLDKKKEAELRRKSIENQIEFLKEEIKKQEHLLQEINLAVADATAKECAKTEHDCDYILDDFGGSLDPQEWIERHIDAWV